MHTWQKQRLSIQVFGVAPASFGAYLMLKENPKFSSTEKSNSGLQAGALPWPVAWNFAYDQLVNGKANAYTGFSWLSLNNSTTDSKTLSRDRWDNGLSEYVDL